MEDLVRVAAEGGEAELAVRVHRAPAPGAPTMLYLHGFGSSQDGEKACFFRARARRAGFTFISLDFQGHGLSGGTMRGLSLTRCLRDVDRVRRRIPELAGPVGVAGSSMGGLVALWHAAVPSLEQPVRSLVLIAPALGLEQTLRSTLGEEGMARWQRDGVLEVTNELGTFELGWNFVADLAGYPTTKIAALHKTPALIFQGKLDDRVAWREVEAFARAAATWTRLELLEDGDHRLIERLDWIAEEGLQFQRHATPAGSTT